ncbi:2' O-ribose methyltransferase [Tulasnella sp. 427]|nr:2' O-ribose methyltransferase [Tulasnella sp. 427]
MSQATPLESLPHQPQEQTDCEKLKICPRAVLDSLSKWRIDPKSIKFTESGTRKQGASANVELATLLLTPEEQRVYSRETLYVAVKSFRLADNRDDRRVLASLAHEVNLISKFRHHNVIQLRGFTEDIENDVAGIILPWEANGNMKEFINSENWEIPERVSLGNILVNSKNRAVITDFGSARVLGQPTLAEVGVPQRNAPFVPSTKPNQSSWTKPPRAEMHSLGTLITLTGTAWTLRWAAPELVNDERPGLASDIWAFAWICWEGPVIPWNRQGSRSDDVRSVELLIAMGDLRLHNGNLCEAANHYAKAAGIAHCSSNPQGLKDSLSGLGNVCNAQNGLVEVGLSYMEAWKIYIGIGDQHGISNISREVRKIRRLERVYSKSDEKPGEGGKVPYQGGNPVETSSSQSLAEIQASRGFPGDQKETMTQRLCLGVEEHRCASVVTWWEGDLLNLKSNYAQAEDSYIEARGIWGRIASQMGRSSEELGIEEFQRLASDSSKAEALYNTARTIFATLGDKLGVADAAIGLGEIRQLRHEYGPANTSYTEAEAIYDRIGEQLGRARANLGARDSRILLDKQSQAATACAQASAICKEIIARRRVLGMMPPNNAEHAKAEALYSRARKTYREKGDQRSVANAIPGLGDVQRLQSHYSEAESLYNKARKIYKRMDDSRGAAQATLGLGDVQRLRGKYAKAEQLYTSARRWFELTGDVLGCSSANSGLWAVQELISTDSADWINRIRWASDTQELREVQQEYLQPKISNLASKKEKDDRTLRDVHRYSFREADKERSVAQLDYRLRDSGYCETRFPDHYIIRQSRDPFVRQRNQGTDVDPGAIFRARSAFKLVEMNERFKFLNGANTVVDLGGAPGGWSQVVAKGMEKRRKETDPDPAQSTDAEPSDLASNARRLIVDPKVIAVDLLPIAPIPGVVTIQGDFLAPETRKRLIQAIAPASGVDVVLSDMAPNMSGNRLRDIDLSLELCTMAFDFAKDWLVMGQEAGKPHGGVLVMKYFEHPELQAFRKEYLQTAFRFVSNVKPSSSRSESSEAYWVCSGFQG